MGRRPSSALSSLLDKLESKSNSSPPRPQKVTPYVVEVGPDHRHEYYYINGDLWIREIQGDLVFEQSLTDRLTKSPWERVYFFTGVDLRSLDEMGSTSNPSPDEEL